MLSSPKQAWGRYISMNGYKVLLFLWNIDHFCIIEIWYDMLGRPGCHEISHTSQGWKGRPTPSRKSHDRQPLVLAARRAYFHDPDKHLRWLLGPRTCAYVLWNLPCNNRVNMTHSQQNRRQLHKTSLKRKMTDLIYVFVKWVSFVIKATMPAINILKTLIILFLTIKYMSSSSTNKLLCKC